MNTYVVLMAGEKEGRQVEADTWQRYGNKIAFFLQRDKVGETLAVYNWQRIVMIRRLEPVEGNYFYHIQVDNFVMPVNIVADQFTVEENRASFLARSKNASGKSIQPAVFNFEHVQWIERGKATTDAQEE